jgi:hypothetical protein
MTDTFRGYPLSEDVVEDSIPIPGGLGTWLLSTVREVFRKMLMGDGTYCPCCGRFSKVYRRKLNSGMAAGLIWLVRAFEVSSDWIEPQKDAPRYVLNNREMGKLVHWGLAELKPNDDDSSRKTTGLWRPTRRGIDFVYNRCIVPARVYLYLNMILGFDSKMISIQTALGNKFDYEELMRS